MVRKASIPALLTLLFACTIPLQASELTQVDAGKMAQQGIALFKKGDYANAIRFLSARSRVKPEDADVYYYLGNCYLQTKQNDLAAHMFSACVRVAPASQAGKYALSALLTLSTMPKTADPPAPPPPDEKPDPLQTAATKDSLMTERALDKAFNDSVNKIKSYRQGLKSRLDHVWLQMQDEMQGLQAKGNANYATDLEKMQKEAENKVQDMQTKQLRLENRMLAPDKIDVRAIPQLPSEKIDDTKTALGSLLDYFKPEKPFDPFGTDITPELTSKFLTIKDVFGELPTYQGSARKLAKQVFMQLKNSIEVKQDMLDQQLYQLKANLIHDVINVKMNYGNNQSSRNKSSQVNPLSFITSAKLPRSDSEQLSPMEQEVHQAVERSKKRIKNLEETYYREVDIVIAGSKEKLGGMVAQTGQMNSQLQKPSGNIQLVPQGTDMYTRNYVNFGDRPGMGKTQTILRTTGKLTTPSVAPVPLSAGEAKKLPPSSSKSSRTGAK